MENKNNEIEILNQDLATFTSLVPRAQRATMQDLGLPARTSQAWKVLGITGMQSLCQDVDAGDKEAIEFLRSVV